MHKHCFVYPPDFPENVDSKGRLTGVCRCGKKQKSYGAAWALQVMEGASRELPSGNWNENFDLNRLIERIGM